MRRRIAALVVAVTIVPACADGRARAAPSAHSGGATAAEAARVSVSRDDRDTVDFERIMAGVRPRGFGRGSYALLSPTGSGRAFAVATTGDDAAAGTADSPFRTIARAAEVAGAGDVVTIAAGTYAGSVRVRHSGTASAPIVFQAASRGDVVLTDGNATFGPATWTGGTQETGELYVTVRGLTFRRYAASAEADPGPAFPAAVRAARGWTVDDCLFDSAGNTAISIMGSHVTVRRSTLQYAYVEALSAWSHSDAASAGDPRYTPLDDVRVEDVVLRGNHTRDASESAERADYSSKFLTTRGAVLDNVESYENNGPGFWFDTQNARITVRNSYFHDNRDITGTTGTGRGLNLEANWGPALVERNVFARNAGVALAITATRGVTVRDNLFADNRRCVELTSDRERSATFPLRDIEIVGNRCRAWTDFSAIHTIGDVTSPATMRIRADHDVYVPGRVTRLAWWDNRAIGAAASLGELRAKYGWERSGRVERERAP